MADTEYMVRLDRFEGPMDLLLHLIRRAEVDVHDIPIATIADQYLDHLKGVERIDVDIAGEFLLMAATLMEIKSRTLAPKPEGEEDEEANAAPEEDPRAELVSQLLEYKRTRDASETLGRLREAWARRHQARASTSRDALTEAEERLPEVELEDLELYDLVEAFERILDQVDFARLGEHHVTPEDDAPLELHAEDIMDLLRRREPTKDGAREVALRALLAGRPKLEMIGVFLAALELVRQQRVRVVVEESSGEVTLRLAEEEAAVEVNVRTGESRASAATRSSE